jgi:hypothetical protein
MRPACFTRLLVAFDLSHVISEETSVCGRRNVQARPLLVADGC